MSWMSVFVFVLLAVVVSGQPNFLLEDTVTQAKANINAAEKPMPTGINKDSYLQTMAGINGYFRSLQNAAGKIIDPVVNSEVQYATPCFAHAAIVQAIQSGDPDTLQAGLRALNSSVQDMAAWTCANGHCNFFTVPVMLGIEAARPYISANLFSFYLSRMALVAPNRYSNNGINWGIVAAAGEWIRYQHGLTTPNVYIQGIIRDHVRLLSENGLYKDPTPASNPSTAYDLFPRLFLDVMLDRGYNDTNASLLSTLMERAAYTSLLLQSPQGEWPTGGRSSQHQWNDAVQVALYEMRANQFKAKGDMLMASAFKRAAHLAFKSFNRWVSEAGYVYVLKNRMPIVRRWGYEVYSELTNYNGLPASFIAIAYQVADDTIPEGPSFAETGGYVFAVESHNKIIANIKGNYMQFETKADPAYDATGLTRVHRLNVPPLYGPTAGTTGTPNGLAVGVAWTKDGVTEALAQFGTPNMPQQASLSVSSVTPSVASFSISYSLSTSKVGVTQVVESVTLEESKISISTAITGAVDTVTFRYPVFLNDGQYNTSYGVSGSSVTMFGGVNQTYSVVQPANVNLQFENTGHTSRNGLLGVASAIVPGNSPNFQVTITSCANCLAPVKFAVPSQYATIALALQAARALNGQNSYVISIAAGTYNEKIVVDVPHGILQGTGDVIISYTPTSAADAVLQISAGDVKIRGLTFYKSVNENADVGNVITISQSEVSIYDSKFIGFNKIANFGRVQAYFSQCYFEGGNDMLSGSGQVYFYSCTFASNAAGSVTAMTGISTGSTDQWVMNNAEVKAVSPSSLILSFASNGRPGVVNGQNYLGRAADAYSRVAFAFSSLPSSVSPAVWNGNTANFLEFQNSDVNGLFTTSRASSVNLLTGDGYRSYTVGMLLGNGVSAPQWIDEPYLPQCGKAYAQCGGASFTGPSCCEAPYSCIYVDQSFSGCEYVKLSPRGDGDVRLQTSGTIGLDYVYVNNPWGEVTVLKNESGLNALFDAHYVNANEESITSTVVARFSEATVNVSIDYNLRFLSDPRNVSINVIISLPTSSRVKVVDVTPGRSTNTSAPTTTPATSSTPATTWGNSGGFSEDSSASNVMTYSVVVLSVCCGFLALLL